ncbi:leucine--tRNA ligase [Candidatus Gracilibacteria bacterium]|nr:leucine--tRNA ligase [Candidatus Gracilibacteria bacterium]
MSYDGSAIEQKWQAKWREMELHKADLKSAKPKYYNLVMFPYPSGDKLHIGHWYNYGPADSWGRYMRMKGFNVLQPMGFDSFGLPAENYAIKTGVAPAKSISENVGKMREQLSAMGAMWDWDKEVVTSDPSYYRWTQWVFLELYKAGLAYKKKAAVNWCNSCQTVLANEQVENGHCERCKSEVVKKDLEQWFFKISGYAEKLLDYEGLDWPEKTILMQKNWIGRSEGAEIDFKFEDSEEVLTCYTTRPDTLFSVTFMVIAPEHPLVAELVAGTAYEAEVVRVQKEIMKQTDIERTSEGGKDKLGAFTGKYVINPATGEAIPVYIANFALMYGTGVVMADAHDERDFEFARKYGIGLKFVISEDGGFVDAEKATEPYLDDGLLFDSGEFSGMQNREALPKMIEWMEKEGFGRKKVNYRLRDWLISRQRYWGAPIPIVYDPSGAAHIVPAEHLPWVLPEDVDFMPDGTAPLARSAELVERTERIFGKGWRPEVDTMDTFMCSSWYFLRYPDSANSDQAFDKAAVDKWLPVDMYIGGPEHACMHLLYARFIHRALFELGHVGVKEPFKKLVHQGMVTKDGAKMSKSKGNVVSPDEFVEKYGSDVFRMYLMFMGPFTEGGDWNDRGITGIARFVERFYRLVAEEKEIESELELYKAMNKLIKKVSEDIEKMQFNTCVAAMMEFVNFGLKNGVSREDKLVLARLIAPFAPHLAEECFEMLGGSGSVFEQEWPEFDASLATDDLVTLGVQVNGKVRGEISVLVDASAEEVLALARAEANVLKYLAEGEVVKEIYVAGKIVGFVVK